MRSVISGMLPIFQVLEPLKAALEHGNRAVLAAPPGAGKTTVTPAALLGAPWAQSGLIILLEPRRLAARAAARRLAQGMGEEVGATVGLRVRMQSLFSAQTRLLVVTEGVFTRMILEDQALEGVAGVIFDEFHERNLEADLGLALALQTQSLLREDLRILVMSATLETERVAALLGGAPVIASAGRLFAVRTEHLGRGGAVGLEAHMAKAVRKALLEEDGSILAFLPGQREILRTRALLEGHTPPDVDVTPLYGALPPEAQDAAIAPPIAGRRKVVLTTPIAETSLTIEGVRIVIDGGLARVPCFDPDRGLERLETVRISRASADQRRGRAGRSEPGVCYRLWDEEETRGLLAFSSPQILQSDLTGFALDLALFGVRDPSALALLDLPPPKAFAKARALLAELGALDEAGSPTDSGRRLGRIPLAPRLARLVLDGAAMGFGRLAAELAVLLTERGLGGEGADLETRLQRFERERGPRAQTARSLAAGWARAAGPQGVQVQGEQVQGEQVQGVHGAPSIGRLLLSAFPERLGRRRGRHGEFILASGRGVFLDPAEPLAGESFIVAAELGGGGGRDRVLLAAAVEPAQIRLALEGRLTVEDAYEARGSGRLLAVRRLRFGAVVLEETSSPAPADAVADALLAQLRSDGLGRLPWSRRARGLQARAAFLRRLGDAEIADLSDAALFEDLEAFAAPLLDGRGSLGDVGETDLEAALEAKLGWDGLNALEKRAPVRFATPAGSSAAIDYEADGGPLVEVRVQEMFGLNTHPAIAGGRAPLALALTSPARRPLQITRDLPRFWAGSWADVRKEMRGRYPRHPWPEDPSCAAPTVRAKPKGA